MIVGCLGRVNPHIKADFSILSSSSLANVNTFACLVLRTRSDCPDVDSLSFVG